MAADWYARAACKGLAPMFDIDRDPPPQVLKICRGCPVRDTCLAESLAEEGNSSTITRAGIRGGLTPRQRLAISGASKCDAGHTRSQPRKACDACREAFGEWTPRAANGGHSQPWTDAEIHLVSDPDITAEDVARATGRTAEAVRSYRLRMRKEVTT